MPTVASAERVAAGGVLRINVPEATGGKTVIGQLTVDDVLGSGFVTAYPCAAGLPVDAAGSPSRSDLNFDGALAPVASNRLIVDADAAGDVCFFASQPAELIVDVNGISVDTGIVSFANRRTDTRSRPLIAAGGVLRVNVPEARGGRTVVGQVTVDRATTTGYVTAYPCADGLPMAGGGVVRSDVNYVGGRAPVASNRLLVAADAAGDVCFYTSQPVAVIVDVNGVTATGISSFPNRRTDTRSSAKPVVAAGTTTRIVVPEAAGGRTVIGQLTVDRATGAGYVTAFPCAGGLPVGPSGEVSRSDVNVDAKVAPVASNRLIVAADNDGAVCFRSSLPVALIVDVNAVAGAGISSFANRRFDTRTGETTITGPGAHPDGTRQWAPFTPGPAVERVAALTGLVADADTRSRPALAVKIDNFAAARPQWGLDAADAVFEMNVEGVSRFVALFHSQLPEVVGPVRSARTQDFDLVEPLNRPVFAFGGANDGVLGWVESAERAGVLAPLNALRSPCASRSADKPGPHNLILDPECAFAVASDAGPARSLWTIDASWKPPTGALGEPDGLFGVEMDGVSVAWGWDATIGQYRRWQEAEPHLVTDGSQIAADNVVVVAVDYVPSIIDARSPEAVTVGTGPAVIHRGGRAYDVTWSRAASSDTWRFFDEAGREVPLGAGVTWVELTRA